MTATQLDLLSLLDPPSQRRACTCGAKPHEHTDLGRLLRRPPACDRTVADASTPDPLENYR